MPVRLKVLRRIRGRPLPDQTWDNNPHLPFLSNEPSKVAAKIQVICSEVVVCVHAHDGIEELVRERQAMGFCVDGKYLVFKTRFADSLPVITGRDPQLGRPYLQVELAWNNTATTAAGLATSEFRSSLGVTGAL